METRMNWRRGLVRAWIAATTLWCLVIAAIGFREWQYVSYACYQMPKLPMWCVEGSNGKFLAGPPLTPISVWLGLAVGPPTVALAVGEILVWVVSAFRSN